VKAVTESFKMSKDAGFKVVTHMMPDLPNVGLERDIEQFIVSLPSVGESLVLVMYNSIFVCVYGFLARDFSFFSEWIHMLQLLLTHADITVGLFLC